MLPRVLSLRFAKHPRHGIRVYASVRSVSRPQKLVHTVIKTGRILRCSCEGNFLGGNRCRHIDAVQRRLSRARS